jgi:hypothetical protein
MEPANCKLVIFPGAVGFEVVLGMLRVLRLMDSANCKLGVATALLSDACCGVVLRLLEPANCELGVATVLLFDACCGVVLRLMDSANCELVILPGAVGFEVVLGVLGVLRVLGVATALLFDECCCVVLRLMDPTNGVWVVSTALLFDEPCGVEKSCRVAALEVARALRCDGNPD